jgi:hypothetical protein
MIRDSFGVEHKHQRGLCMEREWSADGETELERRAYVRVRFVKTFDAMAYLNRREWIETGITTQVW